MQRRMRVILVLLTMTSLLTACRNRENMEKEAEKETEKETRIEMKKEPENESEIEAKKESENELEKEPENESEIETEIKTESKTGTGIEQANEQLQGQNGHTDKNGNGESENDLEMYKSEAETDGAVNFGTAISAAEGADSAMGSADKMQGETAAIEKSCFYYAPLTEDIKARITGSSYPDTDEPLQISYEDLSYVHVLHYDFEGQVQEGELICNQAIAQDLADIFYELYEGQYPIEKMRLIDEYGADDEASMADNNTSCFNYRTVPGRTKLSNHSYGLAIDINPLYNPYVRTKDGRELISPDNAGPYADRSADFPHKIDKNDLCYRVFIEHGFTWGGAWNSSKDYQHFEKSL